MATQEQLFCFPLTQAVAVPMDGNLTAIAPAGNGDGAPITVPITDPGVDLAKKTVCIKVRLSTMGNTRKVSTSQIEADADKDLLRVSKRLVASAELKAIGRFDGEIRRFLYNICLPFEIGIHLLPIAALETVECRRRQVAEDRKQLVTAFISAYPSLCQDAAKRLRGLYNPADYPHVEDVERGFGFSWQYVSFGVPDELKGISREVWAQEREKAAQRMAETSAEIQLVLRDSMAKLVQHMADCNESRSFPPKFSHSFLPRLSKYQPCRLTGDDPSELGAPCGRSSRWMAQGLRSALHQTNGAFKPNQDTNPRHQSSAGGWCSRFLRSQPVASALGIRTGATPCGQAAPRSVSGGELVRRWSQQHLLGGVQDDGAVHGGLLTLRRQTQTSHGEFVHLARNAFGGLIDGLARRFGKQRRCNP
jgi:hypothetical protein